jgi:uncharacterized membrane protein
MNWGSICNRKHAVLSWRSRFGLITLSEIASRALSPAVNDPGTAIQIISSHVRLFSLWAETGDGKKEEEKKTMTASLFQNL